MAKVTTLGQMVDSTQVIMLRIRNRVMELIFGLMVNNSKVIG